MKWNKIYLAITDDGAFGWDVLTILKHRYNIPVSRCFNFCRAHIDGTTRVTSLNCLSRLDLSSKLVLCGHSNPFVFSMDGELLQPPSLALYLASHGLRKVGKISFKSCCIGKGDFLDVFASELNRRGIKAGWLQAYTEILNSQVHLALGIERMWVDGSRGNNKDSVRIVKGNAGLAYPPK